MSVIVTKTKILPPNQRLGLISRPRVLKLLDDILDYPFTLISAPAVDMVKVGKQAGKGRVTSERKI